MAMTELPELLSREEMKKNKIPLQYRDRCARLWIPLTKCRQDTFSVPWKCNQERHDYEECEYLDFKRRVKELELIKADMKAADLAKRALDDE
ncbi:hypothetical protein BABINDRAFT_12383 [Babjeviella inositovora NRRL Y-12698]|uniref:NADH dehydrogenase [ubiquinone] 1 beta subcomplex subunit 7 n=1 Tax=Babjeviella inositovora NRRL Y-12698 TaxID=984486 RepID=A0A1E3QU90_9ASCO|nr:uncharacterized protein BABINDRAFT_12383 [Babjeviella inositovora NRRL Y-12698]ODQ81124.1 hypothetical protein BABINDRAFT_12383 [Babjeviella inositovora NRRL Y-12698]